MASKTLPDSLFAARCLRGAEPSEKHVIPTQGGLPGFDAEVATDRLFLGIFPDQQAAADIVAMAGDYRARHGLAGKPQSADRLHATLFHLGDWVGVPADIVAKASAAMARIVSPAFEVAFDRVGSFDNHRSANPVVLTASQNNQALLALHEELVTQLRRAALGQWTKSSFLPHVTLAYDKRIMPIESVTPVSWRVGEVVLIHSLLGQTRHIRLAQHVLGH